MATFIILTAEQTEECSTDALRPVCIGDRYILGLNVLNDPTHEDQHTFLASLPQEEVEIPQLIEGE